MLVVLPNVPLGAPSVRNAASGNYPDVSHERPKAMRFLHLTHSLAIGGIHNGHRQETKSSAITILATDLQQH